MNHLPVAEFNAPASSGADSITLHDVTVIIVTHESAHCIEMLVPFLQDMPFVTFVDNASSDGTVDAIRQHLPSATIIENLSNLGFGSANNRALKICKTRYALLLNPDCLVDQPAFDKLLSFTNRHRDAAILAPHLIRRNRALELSYRWPSHLWKSSGQKAEGACCVGFVSGAVMLLNLNIMHSRDFFDERFFLYYEDEDLCLRMFNQKQQVIVLPEIEITHFSRGSVRGSNPMRAEYIRGFHHAQSKLIFEEIHANHRSAASLRWRTLALAIMTLIPRLLIPQPKYLARLVGRIAGLLSYAPRPTLPIK